MATDRVVIHHPETKRTSNVTATSFERVWKARGWKKATEDLTKLGKDELVEKATTAGVDASGTKAEIITRLQNQES